MKNIKGKLAILTLTLILAVSAQLAAGIENTPIMGMPLTILGEGAITTESEAPAAPATFVTSEVNTFQTLSQAVKSFSAVNPDVKGWLMIPGTNINFPVTYSNNSNSYYLYRDWKGNNYPDITWQNWYNFPDNATYVDYRHRWGDSWETSSKNNVLYGHNWSNLRAPFVIGSSEANDRSHKMFSQLASYNSIEFAKWQPHIYYSTEKSEGIWRIFSVGYCEISPTFFYNNSNATAAQRQEIVDEWKKRSIFNFGVDVNGNDTLLTLTTCTRQYGSTEYQRFVVVARLLRPGESEKDPVSITVNQNVKAPDFTQPVTYAQLQAQQEALRLANLTLSTDAETPARSEDDIQLSSNQ